MDSIFLLSGLSKSWVAFAPEHFLIGHLKMFISIQAKNNNASLDTYLPAHPTAKINRRKLQLYTFDLKASSMHRSQYTQTLSSSPSQSLQTPKSYSYKLSSLAPYIPN